MARPGTRRTGLERQSHAHDAEGRLILTGAVVNDLQERFALQSKHAADLFLEEFEVVACPHEPDPVNYRIRAETSDELLAHLARAVSEAALGAAIAWSAMHGLMVIPDEAEEVAHA